jgi:hypothetical protein
MRQSHEVNEYFDAIVIGQWVYVYLPFDSDVLPEDDKDRVLVEFLFIAWHGEFTDRFQNLLGFAHPCQLPCACSSCSSF